MKKVWLIVRLMLFGLFTCILFAQGASADVPIVFDLPAGMDPTKVWVQFTGATITGTYRDTTGKVQNLHEYTPVSFAQITSPIAVGGAAPANKPAVLISNFTNGRIYVNFGDTGLQGLSDTYPQPACNADNPDPNSPQYKNYRMRWQYLEPFISSNEFDIDISYIDFAAISWSIEAKNAPVGVNNLTTHVDGQTLVDMGGSSASPVDGNIILPGKKLPDPAFARALGSHLAPSGEFHDWSNYLVTTLQGKTTRIAGVFQGLTTGPSGNPMTQAQTYDFDVKFDSGGNATMKARAGSGNGQAVSVDPAKRGPGIGDNVQITITYDAMNEPTGIYGNNPANTYWIDGVKTTNPQPYNDVIGWIIGDLMAGLSFGCLGSPVHFDGQPIGTLFSSQWWGNAYDPDKDYANNFIDPKDTPTGQGVIFDKAQPGQPDNYDNWAAKVHPSGDGYASPFQDRLGKVLMTVKPLSASPNFYALVKINPDDHAAQYTVTPSAGANGNIAPNTPQSIDKGKTAAFTVTPDAGYTAAVGGTCGGTLAGDTYTTNPINENCTVAATFTAVNQYTVTGTAGTNGTISPGTRTVNEDDKTSFTVTPDVGYEIDTVTGCGGTLVGDTYTTGAITADCTVNATFKASAAYTVTPSAGANGSIAPNTPQTVYNGRTTEFTVTPSAGYTVAVGGTCGGTLAGTTYTTNAITADCTVSATFSVPVTHTVTPSAGANGTISPSTPQTVQDGLTTEFTVTPSAGYTAAVGGTCGGTLAGTTYTTNAITVDCTVSATFSTASYIVHGTAGSGGSIDPASRTVSYGQTTTFTVTPDNGYRIVGVTGFGGSLSGNTYTTGPITGGGNVIATFTSITPIPTLSEWGMIIMIVLLGISASAIIYRREKKLS